MRTYFAILMIKTNKNKKLSFLSNKYNYILCIISDFVPFVEYIN